MKSKIIIKTHYNTIVIPIYDKISVITGDSATGKTKMLRLLNSIKKSVDSGEKIESNIQLDDIVIINDKYTLDLTIKCDIKGKIIFIDRGNILLDDENIKFLHESNNIFIVMGHRNITGITSQDAILGLDHDGINFTCYQIYEKGILYPRDII